MTILQSEIVVAKIMNRIIWITSFFILFLLIDSGLYSQNWNLTTVCGHDVGNTIGQPITIHPLVNDINQNAQPLSLRAFHLLNMVQQPSMVKLFNLHQRLPFMV
jgi:hypothetical protein